VSAFDPLQTLVGYETVAAMRWSTVIASSAVIVACTSTAERQQSALIDRIEARISLPAGAWPLKKYARYYASDAHGDVAAVYFVHREGEMQEAKSFCAHGDVRVFPCGTEPGTLRMIRNGQRVWLDSPDEFPGMSGGGCGEVDIHYHVKTDRFDTLECNGPH